MFGHTTYLMLAIFKSPNFSLSTLKARSPCLYLPSLAVGEWDSFAAFYRRGVYGGPQTSGYNYN